MTSLGSRGTHGNDGNRQVPPVRIPAGCANTSIAALSAFEGPKTALLALNDFYFEFPENHKWEWQIFMVILGEPEIPDGYEPVRTRLLP